MSRLANIALASIAYVIAAFGSASAAVIFDNGVSVLGNNVAVLNYSDTTSPPRDLYAAPFLTFNMGASNRINEISIFVENYGASCGAARTCTASPTAKLSLAIRAVSTPPVSSLQVVDPATLLFSVDIDPPAQPFVLTRLSATGLDWGLAANTMYELVLVPSAGASDKWWDGILADTNQSYDPSARIVGTTSSTSVPEPSSTVLLLCSFLALLPWLQRRPFSNHPML